MSKQSVEELWEQLKTKATPKRPLTKKQEKRLLPFQTISHARPNPCEFKGDMNVDIIGLRDFRESIQLSQADDSWDETDEDVDHYLVSPMKKSIGSVIHIT